MAFSGWLTATVDFKRHRKIEMGKSQNTINRLLIALIVLDITIAIVAFFSPGFWFKIFHGAHYVDPQGFLRRCGANWTAFALLQIIALTKWRKRPYWLAIVAGVRLSDMFTDWTYLYFSSTITLFGRISLFAISPLNIILGLYFLNAYKKITKPLSTSST